MKPVTALAVKDLRLIVRDKFALFWIFAFPLMFALFFGAIFGSDSGGGGRGAISLAIVDEDRSHGSRRLVEHIADNESVRVQRVGELAEGQDPDSLPIEFTTREDAREQVQKGRRAAYLRIPAGYGENPYALFGAAGDQAPTLEIGIDPGRQAEAGFLQGILMQATFGALQERFGDDELLRADLSGARAEVARSEGLDAGEKLALQTFLLAADVFVGQFDLAALGQASRAEDGQGSPNQSFEVAPFEVVDVTRVRENEPRSTFDITFPQALVWGLMSVAMSFAITLVRERETGTLLRLRMAPIGRTQMLAGKALACFIGCVVTMSLILGFGVLALGVRVDSVPLLALGIGATSTCFTGLMMTISVMGKTEPAVAGSSWGLLMPFAMIGGGMIPLIAMPDWLVKASVISPFKWAITAIEGAVWRGFGVADMLLPCGILVAMGLFFFALGVLVFRKLDG